MNRDFEIMIVPVFDERQINHSGTITLEPEGRMITDALEYLLQFVPNLEKCIISGSSGQGVYYDDDGLLGKNHPAIKNPQFHFAAWAEASHYPSTAKTFTDNLIIQIGILPNNVIDEPLSLSDEESATCVALILRNRLLYFAESETTSGKKPKLVGVLARLHRMSNLLKVYREQGIAVEPFSVEDAFVAKQGQEGIDRVVAFYDTEAYRHLYDPVEMRQVLEGGGSIGQLNLPYWACDMKQGPFVRAATRYEAAQKIGRSRSEADDLTSSYGPMPKLSAAQVTA